MYIEYIKVFKKEKGSLSMIENNVVDIVDENISDEELLGND